MGLGMKMLKILVSCVEGFLRESLSWPLITVKEDFLSPSQSLSPWGVVGVGRVVTPPNTLLIRLFPLGNTLRQPLNRT